MHSGRRRYIKAVTYLLILAAAFFLVQAAISSLSYYYRCNNWVIGSNGRLSTSEDLDLNKAKAVALDYLRSLAIGDYDTVYALTLPSIRPDYAEFAATQVKLRNVYIQQLRAQKMERSALAEDLELVMNVKFSAIRNTIFEIEGVQLNRDELNDCRWIDRTLLLQERHAGVFWMILGKQDDHWMLVSISETDPSVLQSMPTAPK